MVSPRITYHLAALLDRLLLQLACALGLLVALGCPAGCAAAPPEVPVASPALQSRFVAAILVAGSGEQAVFDNARRDLAAELRQVIGVPLVVTSLSASRRAAPARDVLPATLANIEAALAATAPKALACFVFATSHGTRRGLVLSYEEEVLTPNRLDAMLERHCAGKPTIAVISGCFSGVFAEPPMTAENRIVLTAAARDRTSFGCSDDLTYTYFDEALLGLLPRARSWEELYARLKAAIAERERDLGERPSRPQASFGAAVPRGELLDW